MEKVDNIEPKQQIAVFHLDKQYYGIDIKDVNEIIHMQDITGLPNTAPHIEGVINLRGKLCTILNGRVLLGISPKKSEIVEKIVVLETAPIGIIVDEVSKIVEIEETTLKTLEGMEGLDSLGFIDYLVEIHNRIITVLNVKKMVMRKERKEGTEEPRLERLA